MPWQSAIASQLHFSEMMLYGTYVDEVLGGPAAATSQMKSVAYSEEVPLTAVEIRRLLRGGPTDVLSVMISAKSGIPHDLRMKALTDYADHLAAGRSTAQEGVS
jgi:hypothetical protein